MGTDSLERKKKSDVRHDQNNREKEEEIIYIYIYIENIN